MKDLKSYIEQFARLRRAPGAVWTDATRKQAPHKPILLLAVMDLISRGVISSRFIDIKGDLNELNELFTNYWRRVVPLAQSSRHRLPLSRLHNEPFWKLVSVDGKDITPPVLNDISTVNQLRTVALGANLDDDLFHYMQIPESREAFRDTLLTACFSETARAALLDQAKIHAQAYEYSKELVQKARLPIVQQVIDEVTYQPEARDQGFRRAVVIAYDHRCALCGVRLITSEGHTVVDAAHIQPWSVSRIDDIRNGMALCKICHWAFDEGLMGVSDSYVVLTSVQITAHPNIPGNLFTLSGRGILPPAEQDLWPAQQYLQWHRINVLGTLAS